jgi:biotin-(acetyl-CoA carboxylase) ligase
VCSSDLLALGARLAQELGDEYARAFVVRWPNDILVASDGRESLKVAGILVDQVDLPEHGPVEVAGVGVNVTTPRDAFSPEFRDRATSLAEVSGGTPSLDDVEGIVTRSAMRAAIGLRGIGGVEATRGLCRRRLLGVGRRVSVDGHDAGTIVGLGDEGELLLDRGGERVAIRAGDVRLEEDA